MADFCFISSVRTDVNRSSFHLTQVLVDDVKVLPVLFKNLLDPEYPFSDQICTILSNLTRHEKTCKTVFQVIKVETFKDLAHVVGLHYTPLSD